MKCQKRLNSKVSGGPERFEGNGWCSGAIDCGAPNYSSPKVEANSAARSSVAKPVRRVGPERNTKHNLFGVK